jgi:hypothetical protein
MFCSTCGKQLNDRAVICPQCGVPTVVPVPAPVPAVPAQVSDVSDNTFAAMYFLTPLFPIVGLFIGIYLLCKKETGHGLAGIGLSIVCWAIWATILVD